MRGKLITLRPYQQECRITPAGAGKTRRRYGFDIHPHGSPPQVRGKRRNGRRPCRRFWDHPRRCGENCRRTNRRSRSIGSPPQVRGKHYRARRARQRFGITPAGAGKTSSVQRIRAARQDHPRRCGENPHKPRMKSSVKGSPPQVRGKLIVRLYQIRQPRITPAGAGKTCAGCCVCCCAGDHPRRCGENFSPATCHSCPSGSPPQVRGKRKGFFLISHPAGITPAGAGKTSNYDCTRSHLRDHPRRCGENCRGRYSAMTVQGSPPQVRGKQRENSNSRKSLGITPAGAGKTLVMSTNEIYYEDHPRRCGENAVHLEIIAQRKGSPPQVRGKLTVAVNRRFKEGITPAGAGKTFLPFAYKDFTQDHPRRCGENYH